jgi:hypothetical protein
VKPFSNRGLLSYSLQAIDKKFGGEVYADYKFHHTIDSTDIRLILPEYTKVINDTGVDDDAWSAGIHLHNSLSGEGGMTSVEAYLFRWWCTNGATTEVNNVASQWSRRSGGQDEFAVYEWAKDTVDDILGGLEYKFDQVQALTSQYIEGEVTEEVIRDIFRMYAIPVSQREEILNELAEADPLTMYALMQAVTRTANDPRIKPERRDKMMRIGGSIPTTVFDTEKARIWNQGKQAEADARNPYEIRMAGSAL